MKDTRDDDEAREEAAEPELSADAIDALSGAGDEPDEAVERLASIDSIHPGRWQEASEAERLDALREVERSMADLQGRPPAEVRAEDLGPGLFGEYDRATGEIAIDPGQLRDTDPAEAVDTMVHEGRHAYQQYAVEHPGTEEDEALVEAWRRNFDQPVDASLFGAEEYRSQPLEADAWEYAGRIREGLYGEERA